MIAIPQQLADDLPKLALWVKRYARDHKDESGRLVLAAEYIDKAAEELRKFESGLKYAE